MSVIALDIGGANLKLADGDTRAISRYFPLWQRPQDLSLELSKLLAAAPNTRHVVATMTGELVDAFRTKVEGVAAIVDALVAVAHDRTVLIYLTDGTFVTSNEAKARSLAAAASNWHALASFAARWTEGVPSVLVDIGSTTCDIIPIVSGRPATRGMTDPERLATGELVYTGVERSPICAVIGKLPWRGQWCRTAHELFATTWDAYLLTGDLPEDPASTHTADGRPATRRHAHDRLARSICADATMFYERDAQTAAAAVADAQCALIRDGLREVVEAASSPLEIAIVSGRGEFLAHRAVRAVLGDVRTISITERLGEALSRVAPAHALAVLAREANLQ